MASSIPLSGWTARSITPNLTSLFAPTPTPGKFTWSGYTPSGWVGAGPDFGGLAASRGAGYSYTPDPTPPPMPGVGKSSADVVASILSSIYGAEYQKLLNYDPYAATAQPKKKPKKKESGISKVFKMGDPIGGKILGGLFG